METVAKVPESRMESPAKSSASTAQGGEVAVDTEAKAAEDARAKAAEAAKELAVERKVAEEATAKRLASMAMTKSPAFPEVVDDPFGGELAKSTEGSAPFPLPSHDFDMLHRQLRGVHQVQFYP